MNEIRSVHIGTITERIRLGNQIFSVKSRHSMHILPLGYNANGVIHLLYSWVWRDCLLATYIYSLYEQLIP